MSEGKPGLGAALAGFEAAHPPTDAPGAPGADRQAAAGGDLFGERQAETVANPIASRTGPGRPPGAINRRTDTLKRWILSLGYKHPAQVLAHIASASAEELRKELPGLKDAEILAAKRAAASDLMPYFEQKLPTAIELPPNDGRPVLIIDAEAGGIRGVEGDVMRLDDALDDVYGEGEQDQALSDADAGRPGNGQSPAPGQVSEPDRQSDD